MKADISQFEALQNGAGQPQSTMSVFNADPRVEELKATAKSALDELASMYVGKALEARDGVEEAEDTAMEIAVFFKQIGTNVRRYNP